ncbi:MAG: hypothetical protein CL557_12495 [Alphaproteobacteria bacterium]|nr:hypothetical protein [Alphaproteobacteria bacterium]|tara:strand:+ start:2513 stop:2986 length:474 start_codon:yes stop_codon:yes gene_type:complete
MSDWNGFGSLDLSKVEASAGSTRLQPGTYTVKCADAKIESVGNTKNKKLVADLVDEGGSGDIRMNFNILHTSDIAQDIGRRQLKSFLISSDHPNPDKPGDIATMKGLVCKIAVGMGKPWKGDDGVERVSSEVKKFMPVTDKPNGKDTAEELDDEIPF